MIGDIKLDPMDCDFKQIERELREFDNSAEAKEQDEVKEWVITS